ncbi:hypothetical protein [Hyphococcus sp.]|uniref:hypothetical protein n=1 Tax=Hyphococcus sp. TaxID=2038636 RepID=UPI003D115A5A
MRHQSIHPKFRFFSSRDKTQIAAPAVFAFAILTAGPAAAQDAPAEALAAPVAAYECAGATPEEKLDNLLIAVDGYKTDAWAGTLYRLKNTHLPCARELFGLADSHMDTVEEQVSYAQIRFQSGMLDDNIDLKLGHTVFGVLKKLVKRMLWRDETTASLEMKITGGAPTGTIGISPLYAYEFSDKKGTVRKGQLFDNGALGSNLPLSVHQKVSYSFKLKYYDNPKFQVFSTIANGAAIAAGFQASPTAALSTMTSDYFKSTMGDIEAKFSEGLKELDISAITGDLYLLPEDGQDAALIYVIKEQKKRPSGAVIIYPHYENSVFVRARLEDGKPNFDKADYSKILRNKNYAKIGSDAYPTIDSYLKSQNQAIFELLKDPDNFVMGCKLLEGSLGTSFGLQYYDIAAGMWSAIETSEAAYHRKEIREKVNGLCPSLTRLEALDSVGLSFSPPSLDQTLVRGEIETVVERMQASYYQLVYDPRRPRAAKDRVATAVRTVQDNFIGVGKFEVTDEERVSGVYAHNKAYAPDELVKTFFVGMVEEKKYTRSGCGLVNTKPDGEVFQIASFLVGTEKSDEADGNKYARVQIDLHDDKSEPVSISINALDADAAKQHRDASPACATPDLFWLPGDEVDVSVEKDRGNDEGEDALMMMGRLDDVPDDFLVKTQAAARAAGLKTNMVSSSKGIPLVQRAGLNLAESAKLENAPEADAPNLIAAAAGAFIGLPDVAWSPEATLTDDPEEGPVIVTVAFEEGNPALFELIEAAANEWAQHSDIFQFSFRTEDNQWRMWSRNDVQRAADIRISFRESGYWSYLGTVASGIKAHEPTMNYAGFLWELTRYYGAAGSGSWRNSYAHSTILHEFGHALGLAHEHYHNDCQADLKLAMDQGYEATLNSYGEFVPDHLGRSPGAVLAFSGPPNYWQEWKTLYALDWENYTEDMPEDAAIFHSQGIDQRSVMLYTLEDYLLAGGSDSRCASLGSEGNNGWPSYATKLSAGDIKYFQTFYGGLAN